MSGYCNSACRLSSRSATKPGATAISPLSIGAGFVWDGLGVQSNQQERVRFKTCFCSIPFLLGNHGQRHPIPILVLEPPELREGDAGMAEGLDESTFPLSWPTRLPGMKKMEAGRESHAGPPSCQMIMLTSSVSTIQPRKKRPVEAQKAWRLWG